MRRGWRGDEGSAAGSAKLGVVAIVSVAGRAGFRHPWSRVRDRKDDTLDCARSQTTHAVVCEGASSTHLVASARSHRETMVGARRPLSCRSGGSSWDTPCSSRFTCSARRLGRRHVLRGHCLRPAAGALEPPVRVALMRDALGRFRHRAGRRGSGPGQRVWMIATASRVSRQGRDRLQHAARLACDGHARRRR